jgi:peptidoglycan/xylan/chitin deacetylase (PgdA/CDA1 family)
MDDQPGGSSLSKRLFRRVMVLPALPECLAHFTNSEATIFMAHRFCIPELGISGHDPKSLCRILAELRKRQYNLISIGEIFRRIREQEPLERAVAFTIDDGYYDAGHVAAAIFAQFDCPVTVFAITDFLDGKIWLWWDKIAYIFMETKRTEIGAQLGREYIHFRLENDDARAGWHPLVDRCYQSSEADRLACIDQLSLMADVEMPFRPPSRYRPLSWDEARGLENKGVSFGPHTLTHPILSTVSAERSEQEITGSWQRLRAELSRPVPVFCYPGGEKTHFGEREIATMDRIGLWGAVTGEPGNVRHRCYQDSANQRYRVPRYLYQDRLSSVLRCVSGAETLIAKLRGRLTN